VRFPKKVVCALLILAALECETGAQEIVISPQFDSAGSFHKGVAPVLIDKLWGLIDHSGNWVARPRYAEMEGGANGLFPVKFDGTWGYIDAKGQLAVQPKFEQAEPFEGTVAAVKSGGRWGYLRLNGTIETDFIFSEIGGREGDYVSARDAKGWAVFKVLPKGSPIRVDFQGLDDSPLQRAYSVSEGSVIAKFKDGERLFLIDNSGSIQEPDNFFVAQHFPVFDDPTKFSSIRRMSEGFAAASAAPNSWGYLHKASGDFLWPGRFQDASAFSRGFAPVKINNKWGYIDRLGRIALQPAYSTAYPFRGDYAVITQGDKRGFLRLGQQGGISEFIAPRFEDAFRFTEGLAPVKVSGRWGYVSDGQSWSEVIDTGIVGIEPK